MTTFIPRASLVTGSVPAALQDHLWCQGIAPMLEASPIPDDGAAPSLPEMHQYHLGRLLFIDCHFSARTFRRDRGLMARHDDADHMALQLYTRGGNHVRNGGVEYSFQPGGLCAVNLAYEVEARAQDSDVLSLILPRQLLLDELPVLADRRGPLFAPEAVSNHILRDHLYSLRRLLPQAEADSIPALTQVLLGMLDALVRHGDITAHQTQSAVFAAICRHVDAHLDDPGLTVESICAKFRCSRATLYRLFKSHGGVREHIQRRRLMACFKAITASRHLHRRIFDVALDYGFVSPSHFSHLFRSHFGISPSDARDMGGRGPAFVQSLDMPSGDSAAQDADRMWHWAKSLTVSAAQP